MTNSNPELNKKLAQLIMQPDEYRIEGNKVIVVDLDGFEEYFEPYKNWDDIMPIAVGLGVSLLPVIDCNGGRSYSVGLANFKKGSWDVPEDEDAFLFEDYHDTSPQIALTKCCIDVLEFKLNQQ